MKVAITCQNPDFNYDFECADNGIIAVYGISGSGKSSLLNALAGFNSTISGVIEFNGKPIMDSSTCPAKVIKCSYMQQHPVLFPHWTIAQNLQFAQKYCAKKHNLADLLQQLDCQQLVDKFPHELSGGEKQRIAFIRALIQIEENSMVLLDEPFSALDFKLRRKALKILNSLNNCLIFLVTHEISEIFELADSLLYIKQGQVIYNADIEQAMQSGIEHMPIASAIIFNDRQHIIYADDVSISLQQQQNSSIRHQIAAQIIAIKPQEAFVLLELELDLTNQKQKLMAKITQQSLQKLALKPQQKVFANFKASAYQTKI